MWRLANYSGRLRDTQTSNRTPAPQAVSTRSQSGWHCDEWHSDITFQPQPSKMSILHMVTCPPVGGDTMWSNLYLAFESLSKPLQDLCLKLTALHDAHPHNHPEQTAIHPVVRKHPDTGRAALYVNEHFTRRLVEMTAQATSCWGTSRNGWPPPNSPYATAGNLERSVFGITDVPSILSSTTLRASGSLSASR